MVSSFQKSKNMVTGIPVHEALQPPLLQSQRSFEGQGYIVEKRTLAQHLQTYLKVYVQCFRSLALLLHTKRDNLLKTPHVHVYTLRWSYNNVLERNLMLLTRRLTQTDRTKCQLTYDSHRQNKCQPQKVSASHKAEVCQLSVCFPLTV